MLFEKRSYYFYILVGLIFSVFFSLGCSHQEVEPAYQHAPSLPQFNQDTFLDYQSETKLWLRANRHFMTENPRQELSLVLPKEYIPSTPNGEAVLLVHGLGDSPYSFIDVATYLTEQGYLVRTLLLPGHASRVGDLKLPTLHDWQGVVNHHYALLKQQTDKIWLGGYSTGANLVMSKALQEPDILGVLLFSPAFEPGNKVVRWSELASYFVEWADQDPEVNPLRYNSLPMNGAAIYYQTTQIVQDALADKNYRKPVFMMLSEGDHVIDTQYAVNVFNEKFNHPNSHLVWLGEVPPIANRVSIFSMDLPQRRIANSSHMGILFSPDNPEYGENGVILICDNGQSAEQKQACLKGEQVWFSAWGYQEQDKVYARLTYNPYFIQSMGLIKKVMQSE